MNLRPKIREAKAPVPVVVGQRWMDRDKRGAERILYVYEIKDGYAFLKNDDGAATRIAIKNLHRKWFLLGRTIEEVRSSPNGR